MSAGTILDTITAQRREDIREAKAAVPARELEKLLAGAASPIDFAARLKRDAPMAVIAEIKRASPSKGDIAPCIEAGPQAIAYAQAGCAGVSVLTEPTWFKGTLQDMADAREAVARLGEARPAVLRKDFLLDEYQVLEARARGADTVLLIVACLQQDELIRLMRYSRELGMEPLVEVNNAAEMERALEAEATVIGVNNRDLRDFSVDPGTTGRLASQAIARGVLLAALSGINSRSDVDAYAAAGAGAILVGEALMRADDPAAKIRELAGR